VLRFRLWDFTNKVGRLPRLSTRCVAANQPLPCSRTAGAAARRMTTACRDPQAAGATIVMVAPRLPRSRCPSCSHPRAASSKARTTLFAGPTRTPNARARPSSSLQARRTPWPGAPLTRLARVHGGCLLFQPTLPSHTAQSSQMSSDSENSEAGPSSGMLLRAWRANGAGLWAHGSDPAPPQLERQERHHPVVRSRGAHEGAELQHGAARRCPMHSRAPIGCRSEVLRLMWRAGRRGGAAGPFVHC
jgi:hypothetical protein